MLIPVSHLFIQILQKDYPFYITPSGEFLPSTNCIFNYLLRPARTDARPCGSNDYTHRHKPILQHHISTPLTITDPTHAGLALHKWALDTISRQIDILSTQIAALQACKMIIAEYDIDDQLFSIETMYRLYYKWKRQTDTTDHRLHLHQYTPPATLTRDQVIDLTGQIIADHLHLFYTTHNHISHKRIKSLCQYMLYTYAGVYQATIAKIYSCTPATISSNITNTRRWINQSSALRQTITKTIQ